MHDSQLFDALIVVTPSDCERLMLLYPRLIDNFRYGRLCFIGSTGVNEVLERNEEVGQKSFFVDENSLIPFDDVHLFMAEKLKDLLKGQAMPRSVTGWYYQQFLKMQYAYACEDEYYMVWDGDTIPCREIKMFEKDTGKPYLDLKYELHQEYFDTLSIILHGLKKVIERSFISEHMLIKKDIMIEMIEKIESNDSLPGTRFWEKILNAIPAEKISSSSFSEFETYGTYTVVEHPDVYELRDWHSFRLGGQFFTIQSIKDRDFKWLGKDFDAISFEKNQQMIGDGTEFFSNPYYQKKLSAKQMLQAIQMEFNGGYKEVWDDDPVTKKTANVTFGGFANGKGVDNRTLIVIVTDGDEKLLKMSIQGIEKSMSPVNYKIVTVQDDGKSFYSAVNSAVKSLDGTEFANWDIYVIKSGTIVVFDSIHFLKHAIYSGEGIGAAGSVSNIAGNDQHLDVKFETDEEYINFGEKNNVLMEEPFEEREVLSGNGVLITREAYRAIHGFGEIFGKQGRAGDIDFSLRLRQAGFKLLLVKNSFVFRKVWDEGEDRLDPEDRIKLEAQYGKELIGKLMGDGVAGLQGEQSGYTTEIKNKLIDLFTDSELRFIKASEDYKTSEDINALNLAISQSIQELNLLAKKLQSVVVNFFIEQKIPQFYIYCDKELGEKMQEVLKKSIYLIMDIIQYLSDYSQNKSGDIYDEGIIHKWGELALILRFEVLSPPREIIDGVANMGNVYAQLDQLAELNRDRYLVKQMWLNSSNKFLPCYEDNDIAIVVQGPIHYERNFTIEMLMRYRKIYPQAPIILSTWEGLVTEAFRFQAASLGIILKENPQPKDGGPWNIKYQLLSSFNGISKAEEFSEVEYVLKTRTDQVFLLPDFLLYMKNMVNSFPAGTDKLSSRIVFPGGFSSMVTYPFRITDFFAFGKVDDLKRYYSASGDCEKLLLTASDTKKKRKQFLDVMGRVPYDNFSVLCKMSPGERKEIINRTWDETDPETYLSSSFYEREILGRELTKQDDVLMYYWKFVKECTVFIDTDALLLLWIKYRNQYMDISSNVAEGGLTASTWLSIMGSDLEHEK